MTEEEERAEARAAYGWADVPRDIALFTPYTAIEAGAFGAEARVPVGKESPLEARHMNEIGIHPYDLVGWVVAFLRNQPKAEPVFIARLIVTAFEAGRTFALANKETP